MMTLDPTEIYELTWLNCRSRSKKVAFLPTISQIGVGSPEKNPVKLSPGNQSPAQSDQGVAASDSFLERSRFLLIIVTEV